LKISFVYPAYPPIPDGGAGFLKNLAETLIHLGAKVSVITTSEVASAYSNGSDGDILLYPVMDNWLSSFKNYNRLKEILRQIQPDVIHTIFPSSSVGNSYQLPMLIKFAATQPLVTTLYGFSIRCGSLWSRLTILTLLHFSDRLLSDNDFVIGVLKRYLPYLKQKLNYMPSGANIPNDSRQKHKPAELRPQYGFNPNSFYICHFGYLDQTRNFESLFQAVKVQRNRGMDARIIMIGGNPFQTGRQRYEELSNLIGHLDLNTYVTWTGFCSEEQVAHYLMCSDLCVLPFRKNTTGRSSLPAALSFGLPVITTSRTKTLFSLRDHENVLLVPPDDVSSLAEAIGELGENHELRAKIGAAGFKLWQEEFSFEVIGRRALSIYQEVANER
jgi:glycosyltransferase involved in cell wall biosynthesis